VVFFTPKVLVIDTTIFIIAICNHILLRKLLLDPFKKISSHIDFLFGLGTSSVLPLMDIEVEYSKKTGRIKNFSLDGKLIGTFRTDGGIALTIYGAGLLLKHGDFLPNCIIPVDDAIPFVSEGRSLFVKHIFKCGTNVKTGSEVAITDSNLNILAVGRSLFPFSYYHDKNYENSRSPLRGVGVKIREGIKSRST
jgi:uncharacterized protein with predicted RNA binding PUA domain